MRRKRVSNKIAAGITAAGTGLVLAAVFCAPSASSAAKDSTTVRQAAKPDGGTGVQHVSTVTGVRMPAFGRYTVERGDTLSIIARKTEENAGCWPGIYRANSRQVKNPDLIYPGEGLNIPARCDMRPVIVTTVKITPRTDGDGDTDGDNGDRTAPQPLTQGGGGYTVSSSFQACVIRAESGGNPYVWNATGHWGLYQFSYGTWVAHGGAGYLFGKAGPDYQTQIFWNTVRVDGTSDWAPYDGCSL